MNKVVPRINHWQHQPVLLATLLLLLLLLTGCFGGGDEATSEESVLETAVQQTGTLTCSESCQNFGQCGTAADGRTVILAHSSQPAFQNHNAILENNSAIVITNQQQINFTNANGTPGTSTFFYVQTADGGPLNWVAGSCVNIDQ